MGTLTAIALAVILAFVVLVVIGVLVGRKRARDLDEQRAFDARMRRYTETSPESPMPAIRSFGSVGIEEPRGRPSGFVSPAPTIPAPPPYGPRTPAQSINRPYRSTASRALNRRRPGEEEDTVVGVVESGMDPFMTATALEQQWQAGAVAGDAISSSPEWQSSTRAIQEELARELEAAKQASPEWQAHKAANEPTHTAPPAPRVEHQETARVDYSPPAPSYTPAPDPTPSHSSYTPSSHTSDYGSSPSSPSSFGDSGSSGGSDGGGGSAD